MVLAGFAFADALVFQAGERGQHVDGRLDAFAVQLAREDDLPLGDVAREVGDRVGLIVLGHGEDGNLRDRTFFAADAARPLVHGGEVGVQIARIAAAAGHFPARGGNLAQGLGVIGDVRKNHQNVHILFEGEVFGGGERHARRGDALDGRVVRQVHEQHSALNGARAPEIADEEIRLFKRDADRAEDHGEIVRLLAEHFRLAGNLRGQVGVRQARAGEHRQFLPAHQRVQPIDGGDASLNEFIGIIARGGVDGRAVHIQAHFRNQFRAAVARAAHAVEHAAEHIHGNGQFDGMTQKARLGRFNRQPLGAFKQLQQRRVAIHFQHPAQAHLAILLHDFHQFGIFHAAHAVHQHQRADDFADG